MKQPAPAVFSLDLISRLERSRSLVLVSNRKTKCGMETTAGTAALRIRKAYVVRAQAGRHTRPIRWQTQSRRILEQILH
jgi:hypothetical protein